MIAHKCSCGHCAFERLTVYACTACGAKYDSDALGIEPLEINTEARGTMADQGLKVCSNCDGAGTVTSFFDGPSTVDLVEVACERCKGTGKVTSEIIERQCKNCGWTTKRAITWHRCPGCGQPSGFIERALSPDVAALTARLEAAEASNQRLKADAAEHEAEMDKAYAALLQSQGKVVVLERELAGYRISQAQGASA